jgi:hypothetical protein
MDRRLDDFQILFRGAEDQVEVSKRIEIAEIGAIPRQHLVVFAQQHLGAAQRIGQSGIDEIAEQIGKTPVGDQVERAHRLVLHRIDQPGAVDEFGLSALDHRMIFRQRFRRHRQIGIQDHQHVTGGRGESLADRIALALAVLLQHLDIPLILVGVANPLAFGKGAVAGIAFHEQDLLGSAEPWHPQNRVLDVTHFVAAGNHDADREFAFRKLPDRPSYDVGAQAQLPDARQRRNEPVDERPEAEQFSRQQLPAFLPDRLEFGDVHQIQKIGGGDKVDVLMRALEFHHLAELQDRLPQMRIIGNDQTR